MKQMEKTTYLTTMGLCAFCTYISSHSSHFLRLIDFLSCHTAHIHIRSLVVGEKKNKTYGLECKTAFGRVMKPTIYIYTDMHIPPSIYIYIFLFSVFSFIHLSVVYTYLTLNKRNQIETSLFTQQLMSYCKTNVS